MAAEDPVKDVNRRFYDAFESLDIKRMEGIWLREDYIKCVHPGWALLSGWDAVMESWRRIFENTEQMRFTLTNVEARVQGELAWVTQYENLASRLQGQTNAAVVLATNIYERRRRRLVHDPPPRLARDDGRSRASFHRAVKLLQDKVCIVTGAGRGIGRAIALLSRRTRVAASVLAARSADRTRGGAGGDRLTGRTGLLDSRRSVRAGGPGGAGGADPRPVRRPSISSSTMPGGASRPTSPRPGSRTGSGPSGSTCWRP